MCEFCDGNGGEIDCVDENILRWRSRLAPELRVIAEIRGISTSGDREYLLARLGCFGALAYLPRFKKFRRTKVAMDGGCLFCDEESYTLKSHLCHNCREALRAIYLEDDPLKIFVRGGGRALRLLDWQITRSRFSGTRCNHCGHEIELGDYILHKKKNHVLHYKCPIEFPIEW